MKFDALLAAVGRKTNVRGFGLEELGLRIEKNCADMGGALSCMAQGIKQGVCI